MNSYIAYFDETGDDGVTTASSDCFILTSLYMPTEKWQDNFNIMKDLRRELKNLYGFHTTDEIHTKHFLTDKNPYRKYKWDVETKKEILKKIIQAIVSMNLKFVNVIIDKTKFKDDNYHVLENALKYNIQRIENDSKGEWNYIIITDQGRIAPMRSTARAIRAYNPIQSKFTYKMVNQPVVNLIEDILEKNSKESHFIQICDFVSFFVYLYYRVYFMNKSLPNRIANVIDKSFVGSVMATLRQYEKLNLKANENNKYGLVIYPK